MNQVLLTLHVIAAILLIGPVTVAASLFPRHARAALSGWPTPDAREVGVVQLLHRISRVYGAVGVLVPLLGLYTAVSMKVMGDVWVLASVAITTVAGGLLGFVVVPRQAGLTRALRTPAGDAPESALTRRLAMFTGIFATLWVVVVILMIVRPGSSTGV